MIDLSKLNAYVTKFLLYSLDVKLRSNQRRLHQAAMTLIRWAFDVKVRDSIP